MAGLCGVVNWRGHDLAPLAGTLDHRGDQATTGHESDRLAVRVAGHEPAVERQPGVAAGGDVHLWLWGELAAHVPGPGDVPAPEREHVVADGSYVAALYDAYGEGFVSRLRGEFVGVVHDRVDDDVVLFTDRVGARPFYHATTAGGEVVFSTTIRALAAYPTVETGFDRPSLYEYLARRRAHGLRTPLAGVETAYPGALSRVREDGTVDVDRYWVPEHEPSGASFGSHLDRFVDLLREVFRDRVRPDLDYGVLLSGGSDSRLVLGLLAERDVDVTAFHCNEWPNREARAAERAADAAGVEFRFLERDADYQRRALERNPALSDFASVFNQAHVTGFADAIADEVDVVVTGHYAAEAVGRFTDLPIRRVGTPLGTLDLPVERPVDTVADYVDYLDDGLPPYLETPPTLADVLGAEIRRAADGSVVNHGVEYRSLRDAVVFGELYPVTNDADYLNYVELVQLAHHWTPFLDDRVVAFVERLPVAFRLRRNIVNRAVRRVAPDLASIPYANTGVPVGYPFAVHYAAETLRKLRAKLLGSETPEPHYSHGSWTDHAELVRHDDFLGAALADAAPLLAALKFVDEDAVEACYRRHRAGEDHRWALYTLVTLLGMPVTEQVA